MYRKVKNKKPRTMLLPVAVFGGMIVAQTLTNAGRPQVAVAENVQPTPAVVYIAEPPADALAIRFDAPPARVNFAAR